MKRLILFVITIAIGIVSYGDAKEKARKFYLTKGTFTGIQVLTACDKGYHMASLWEIFDTSNFVYNTKLGFTLADSGSGPPSNVAGWIRTGGVSNSQGGFPGVSNCESWTTESASAFGTIVFLDPVWGVQLRVTNINPWETENAFCSDAKSVWCLQN